LNRVEKYEYPKDALREALLNAVSHKDYSGGVPIQISVYNDKLLFWNEGQLPENWTIEKLLDKHPSKPYNPDIANAVFRSGYVESWGRGTLKIINECVQFGIPKPKYSYDMSGIWVEFRKDVFDLEYLKSLGLNARQIQGIKFVKENGKITNGEYHNINNCSRNTASNDLSELVERNIFTSSGQKGVGSYYALKN
jgi:ATP-dependent DNA helicase RecG